MQECPEEPKVYVGQDPRDAIIDLKVWGVMCKWLNTGKKQCIEDHNSEK